MKISIVIGKETQALIDEAKSFIENVNRMVDGPVTSHAVYMEGGEGVTLAYSNIDHNGTMTIDTIPNAMNWDHVKIMTYAMAMGANRVLLTFDDKQLELVPDFKIDKDQTTTLYCNENGQPLLTQVVEDYDQLTVVNYEKWYGFYILYSNGTVERVGTAAINEILEQGFRYYDHIPHPLFMIALARYLGALLPTTVLEVVAGRWAIDMEELYNDYDFYGVNEE